MNKTLDILFQYICDIVYDTKCDYLNLDEIDDSHRMIGKGLISIHRFIREQNDFAWQLSEGNINAAPPPDENELASPLKILQAALLNITKQAEQAAAGEYNQMEGFIGELSLSYNLIVERLHERQISFLNEMENNKKYLCALDQNNDMLAQIMLSMDNLVIVTDDLITKTLYKNYTAQNEEYLDIILQELRSTVSDLGFVKNISNKEIAIEFNDVRKFYNLDMHQLIWAGKKSLAFILKDVSTEKLNIERLKLRANKDELTGLSNRFVGMHVLNTWLCDRKRFVICFLELDNLKFINDEFGYNEGDKSLRCAAEIMETFSAETVACRLGGDEFMLLVPGYSSKQTEERLKVIFGDFTRVCNDRDENVKYRRSISYGMVEVDSDNTHTASYLLSAADDRVHKCMRVNKKLRKKNKCVFDI